MKFDRVTYTKTFAIGPYLNEKIGVEIQLDDKDVPEDALDMAKSVVEEWHKENNPHLDYSTKPLVQPDGSLPVIKLANEPSIDHELHEEILKMDTLVYIDEAEEFIKNSPFKYRPELKEILKLKIPRP